MTRSSSSTSAPMCSSVRARAARFPIISKCGAWAFSTCAPCSGKPRCATKSGCISSCAWRKWTSAAGAATDAHDPRRRDPGSRALRRRRPQPRGAGRSRRALLYSAHVGDRYPQGLHATTTNADRSFRHMNFLIVSGLSGSGKTIALQALEDGGFYCIDNLPAALVPQFAEHLQRSGEKNAAIGLDARNRAFLADVPQALQQLERLGIRYRVIFLDADEDVLVKRYKE